MKKWMIGLAAIAASALYAGAGNSRPKNILFIAVDDLKPLLGCYGDKIVKSPRIDKLAERGTVFLHNYCQQAVCGPSRASVMTGLRPDKTGVRDLRTRMRDVHPDIVSLPQYLRSQGFVTAGTGKIYDPRCVDRFLDKPSWSIPFSKPDRLPHPQKPGNPVLGSYHSPKIHKLFEEARAKGLKKYKDIKEFLVEHDAWPVVECQDVPDDAYTDGAIATEGIRLLKELKKENKPFFLAVGFKKPHLPFVAPKKYWDMYNRDEMPVAEFQQKSKNPVQWAYHNSSELRAYTGIPDFDSYATDPSRHLPVEKQKELIHGYYACVSYVDEQIGRLLHVLKEEGLDKNTVVVIWGDHGWHLGDHGLWCKHTDFEQATRSPLIIYAPGLPGGKKISSPTEFVDIFPTLCELVGVPVPKNLDGVSLVPLLKGSAKKVKEYAVSQWPRGNWKKNGAMGYAVRDERYRYVVWFRNRTSLQPYDESAVVGRELYDYKKDPLETDNVVDNPEYKSIVERMDRYLREFFTAQQKKK